MTPAEIFATAADYIERWGHNKGWFWTRFCQDSPCCALGAMRRVAGEEATEKKPQSTVAATVFEAFLVKRGWTRGIGAWNDMPERTKAEVVAMLRDAARAA